jgi:hypothetical protein
VFKSSFLFDVVAVFPWLLIFGQQASVSRLIRLARLPRLLSVLDLSNFNGIIKRIFVKGTREQKHNINFFLDNAIYPLFALVLRVILVIYFIGCAWFFLTETFSMNIRTRLSF